MKKVSIVGTGMGPETTTAEGLRAIEEAEVLLGAQRMIESFAYLGKPSFPEYSPEGVARVAAEREENSFAVLVSGDTGFYSAADGLCRELEGCETRLVPGISSLSYFFAKIKKPWQGAALISCHGRNMNMADTVRRNALTFALTGGNVKELAEKLCAAGFAQLCVWLGEDLGQPGERVEQTTAQELAKTGAGSLSVLAVENPEPDARVRFGIPDGEFVRGEVPMTKAEVRAVSLSRLALAPDSVCLDVGAGTGSVTVEMALAAYAGHVCAVEREEDALGLIRENCRKFHLGNVEVVRGSAPEALEAIPPVDAAFIGGSGGKLREITALLLAKNPQTRLVVNAIAIETACEASEILKENGLEPEITQLCVSRSKAAGRLHLMMAQNPIYVISGGGKDA